MSLLFFILTFSLIITSFYKFFKEENRKKRIIKLFKVGDIIVTVGVSNNPFKKDRRTTIDIINIENEYVKYRKNFSLSDKSCKIQELYKELIIFHKKLYDLKCLEIYINDELIETINK